MIGPSEEPKTADAVSRCLDGRVIGEKARSRLAAAYRTRGGSFSRRSYPALRQAMRDVRRQLEDAGQGVIAHELTRREDWLESWLAAGKR